MTIPTPEERAELRRLAERAACFEWWKTTDKIEAYAGLHEFSDAFIEAINPATVLSLLDALDAAEAEVASLDALFDISPHVEIMSPGGHVNCWDVLVDLPDGGKILFDADTRAEALAKAAEWARKMRVDTP